jgi:hypothetical protein
VGCRLGWHCAVDCHLGGGGAGRGRNNTEKKFIPTRKCHVLGYPVEYGIWYILYCTIYVCENVMVHKSEVFMFFFYIHVHTYLLFSTAPCSRIENGTICTLPCGLFKSIQRRKNRVSFPPTYISWNYNSIWSFFSMLLMLAMSPTLVTGCVADADAMWSILVSCSQSTDIASPIHTIHTSWVFIDAFTASSLGKYTAWRFQILALIEKSKIF